MLGDSLLIAPKLYSASYDLYDSLIAQGKHYNVSYYLPRDGAPWYEYATKDIETGSWKMFSIRDMPVFVKGGTILPIKLHNRRLSLIRTQSMPI